MQRRSCHIRRPPHSISPTEQRPSFGVPTGLSAGAKEIRAAGPSYGDLDRATVQGQPRLATRLLVAAPPADRLDLVGVDLHAERKLIAKIIHSLRLVA